MMILLSILLLADPVTGYEPDAVNATIFMKNGKKIELSDVRVRDLDPWSFSFDTGGKTIKLDLFRIVRITNLEKSREVEVLFNDGTQVVGRISAFDLTGRPVDNPDEVMQYQIREIARVHFVSGSQLRSCNTGHYETRTPYPFCPVCGNLLDLGPYAEETQNKDPSVLPTHRVQIPERQ